MASLNMIMPLLLPAFFRHVFICSLAVCFGCIIGIPIATYLAFKPRQSRWVLSITGAIQTVPSMAFYGILLPFLGIGLVPAVTVLFLYSLSPILRGTYTSLRNVNKIYWDIGRAMGMNNTQLALMVLFPLALPGIISSIRLSSIYIITWATLAALIGAGGLGDLILGGIYNYDLPLILAGALPAALLALVTGASFNHAAQCFSLSNNNSLYPSLYRKQL